MIQTTRWHPDTCDCVLEYQWDDQTPQETRVHTASAVIKDCAFHSFPDYKTHYAAVSIENINKNKLVNSAMNTFGIKHTDVDFSFDLNRVLTLSIPKLNLAQKNTLKNNATSLNIPVTIL